MKLNEALAAARERKGLTLRDVEDMTGLSSALLSQIETGTIKEPSFRSVARICKALGLSLNSLLEDEPLDMPAVADAPGLVWRGVNGRREARWVARADIVKRGYPVKSVRLWIGERLTSTEKLLISDRCNALQGDMLRWEFENE